MVAVSDPSSTRGRRQPTSLAVTQSIEARAGTGLADPLAGSRGRSPTGRPPECRRSGSTTFRHTAVSLLLALGVPPHVVREIAGHSDIKVTMTVYAHGNLGKRAAALAQLGDALSGGLLSPVGVKAPKLIDRDQRSDP